MSRIKYPFSDLGKFNQPYLDQLKREAIRVIESGHYIGGEEIDSFEREFSEYIGVKHTIAVSNGLDALRLIFRAYIELGFLRKGDRVLVPANTFIASALAVTDNGLRVVAAPVGETYNIDSNVDLNALKEIKAIMPVHLYGRSCWNDEFDKLKSRDNILIVEDNAQAIGSTTSDGRKTGRLGHVAAISFYPTKNLGALGDAGAITTNDSELERTIRALANYGSDKRYHNIYKGLNCRMDPIQATMLRVKLKHIDEENERRNRIAQIYFDTISTDFITLPINDGRNVWHQFVVRCAGNREEFREYLLNRGVETSVHYPTPIFEQPCYKDEMEVIGENTREKMIEMCNSILSLPIATISEKEAREISMIINDYKQK